MRMALGLVSLLVVIAIILLLFTIYEFPMLKQSKSARQQAQQIAGRDENHAPVTDAVTLDALDRNGRMEAAVVTSIVPGSTLQAHYGLQNGDVILELGQLRIRDQLSSADEAKDFLLDAYQRNQPVVVMRGRERLVLPIDPHDQNMVAAAARASGAAVDPSGATPPTTPAPPGAATDGQKATEARPAAKRPSGLEGQLEIIRNAGGGQAEEPQ